MDAIDSINNFAATHPDATLWIAVGLICAACCLLLRLDQRDRPYRWPESPDRDAELTRILERHQPTPRRTHSLDDVRFSGVKVCCCGRLVDRRSKRCQCQ